METLLNSVKVRKLLIGIHILEDWIKGKFGQEYTSSAPDDIKILAIQPVWPETLQYQFEVLVSSETFDPVSEGKAIPYIKVLFTEKDKIVENDTTYQLDKEREAIAVIIEEKSDNFIHYYPDRDRPIDMYKTLKNITKAIRLRKGQGSS